MSMDREISLFSAWLSWFALFWLREARAGPSVQQDFLLSLSLQSLVVYRASSSDSHLHAAKYSILASFAIWLALRALFYFQDTRRRHGSPQGVTSPVQKQPEPWGKPLIFPCRTSHTRFFPNKHSFSYSYLFVGVPVGWRGRCGLLSAEVEKGRGWFHVDAEGYLERDLVGLGLRGKLEHYLVGQGVDPKEFPYVYLTTAPRVLGYSFNPVSFWYLYSEQRDLKAMILEVNNTFDERRIYYLPAVSSSPKEHQPSSPNSIRSSDDIILGAGTARKSPRFTQAWPKDFHVSPFNSREGSYTLSAVDPRPPPANRSTITSSLKTSTPAPTMINNTITLLSPSPSSPTTTTTTTTTTNPSSTSTPKLVARIFSTSSALDPTTLCPTTILYLLLRYGWIGFLTFPRILREAWTLFFAKKITVWFRPEVAGGSIPRHATDVERSLEILFSLFLADRVANSPIPVQITYNPAPGTSTQRSTTFITPTLTPTPPPSTTNPKTIPSLTPQKLTLTILTPAFYTRFPHYPTAANALTNEFLSTDPRNRTLSTSSPELLAQLLDNPSPIQTKDTNITSSAEKIRWWLLKHLRCPPPTQSYLTPPPKEPPPPAIKTTDFTPLDTFILSSSPSSTTSLPSPHTQRNYRRTLTAVFLSSRLAFGITELVTLMDLCVIRAVLAWVGAEVFLGAIGGGGGKGGYEWRGIAWMVVRVNAVHIWSWVKGW